MDRLDKYRQGKMSSEELERFTSDFTRAKHDHQRKERWQQLLAAKNIQRESSSVPSIAKTRKLSRWLTAAAAAVALLFAIGPVTDALRGPSYLQLADSFLAEDQFYENRSTTKGEQAVAQLKLQAVYAYNQQDFSQAIQYFEQLTKQGAAGEEEQFFLGLSYLYAQQYPAATQQLEQLYENTQSKQFEQETQWFLALAYLKNQEIEKGKTILQRVVSSNWNFDKAQQLLEQL